MPKPTATAALYYGGTTVQFTPEQAAILKAAILADSTMTTALANADDMAIADWFNSPSPTAKKCWKTSFSKDEALDALNFTAYIARSVGERDAFALMFSTGTVNPSRANVRQGLADIFSGTTTAAVNQRAALVTAMQRDMSRAEALLATGPDAQGAYLLGWEGYISYGESGLIVRG